MRTVEQTRSRDTRTQSVDSRVNYVNAARGTPEKRVEQPDVMTAGR